MAKKLDVATIDALKAPPIPANGTVAVVNDPLQNTEKHAADDPDVRFYIAPEPPESSWVLLGSHDCQFAGTEEEFWKAVAERVEAKERKKWHRFGGALAWALLVL